jgi:hypothetical protein
MMPHPGDCVKFNLRFATPPLRTIVTSGAGLLPWAQWVTPSLASTSQKLIGLLQPHLVANPKQHPLQRTETQAYSSQILPEDTCQVLLTLCTIDIGRNILEEDNVYLNEGSASFLDDSKSLAFIFLPWGYLKLNNFSFGFTESRAIISSQKTVTFLKEFFLEPNLVAPTLLLVLNHELSVSNFSRQLCLHPHLSLT